MAAFSRFVGVSCLALGLLLLAALIEWMTQGERHIVGTLGGAFALFLMLLVVAPGSLLAILLGHLARFRIRRSAGRLAGAGVALTGLGAGYGGLLVLCALVLVASNRPQTVMVNEGSAVAVMRSLNLAAVTYASTYPELGYATRLEHYGPPPKGQAPGPEAAALVPAENLAETRGYAFRYLASDSDGDGRIDRYTLHAFPHEPGRTGVRYFFTDESGVIRHSYAGPASEQSRRVE